MSSSNRPRQYIQNDSSYRETSFGGYTNRGTHLHVSEGTINFNSMKAKDQHDDSLKPLRTSLGLLSIDVYNGISTRKTPKTLFT